MLWIVYETEACRYAAEMVKPVCGAVCALKCSGATCTVSVFDLGYQAEGGLGGAAAPRAIWLTAGHQEMLLVLAGRISGRERTVPRNFAVGVIFFFFSPPPSPLEDPDPQL